MRLKLIAISRQLVAESREKFTMNFLSAKPRNYEACFVLGQDFFKINSKKVC